MGGILQDTYGFASYWFGTLSSGDLVCFEAHTHTGDPKVNTSLEARAVLVSFRVWRKFFMRKAPAS
eukprot:1220622-Alexandrium_andersonii.AAC.1